MNKEEYYNYLKSVKWKNKRKLVIEDRDGKCEICNSKEKLEVHHLTYKNIFNEPLCDLQLLCHQCHSKIHKKKIRKKKNKKYSEWDKWKKMLKYKSKRG